MMMSMLKNVRFRETHIAVDKEGSRILLPDNNSCIAIRRQETADLVTFTEEILNGKLHFLCSV